MEPNSSKMATTLAGRGTGGRVKIIREKRNVLCPSALREQTVRMDSRLGKGLVSWKKAIVLLGEGGKLAQETSIPGERKGTARQKKQTKGGKGATRAEKV